MDRLLYLFFTYSLLDTHTQLSHSLGAGRLFRSLFLPTCSFFDYTFFLYFQQERNDDLLALSEAAKHLGLSTTTSRDYERDRSLWPKPI